MSWRSADESSPNGKDGKLKTEAAGSKAETETHETLAMKLQNASNSGKDSDFKIFPRRKGGQQKKNNDSAPVVITAELLETCFEMPLVAAANKLGICATALKKVCRKLGIHKWPYKEMKPSLSLCRNQVEWYKVGSSRSKDHDHRQFDQSGKSKVRGQQFETTV
ncbi:hypothetical protein GUITHDRAFT_141912 [Guillardia theta CCMP2712]|uniref:RWP-RK domain-containing protein n=1 Tax=Guillardia theta (strain CCMP2712) TaxID=905079 RepID=L1J0K5_GUITC|nr:hypothetical protein GUITHDRAFT_141912 [Guillardia theta CCMP2712]EKX41674.1 hypothetical protein GUITHDRAFT_141912 [Guillardia theta CCMP2712]|eukprot:XP_005828654.1 hypothetical protein GUITHDRAFT_141912 [Guillardia theta CCMP2712]